MSLFWGRNTGFKGNGGSTAIALALALAAAVGSWSAPGLAQQRSANVDVQSIEAVVNDEVISAYDVEQRVNLILSSVDVQITPEQRRLLRQQALQNLVDEKLQLQEAAKFDLVISKEELDQTIAMVAQQYRMTPQQFAAYLAQQGASIEALRAELEAELAWSQLVRGRFRQQIAVGDDEVQAVLDKLEESAGQNEYLVSEILLIAETPEQERQVKQTADRIVDQLRQGVPFAVMARQFSEASTAAVGGDLGWVPEGQLPEEVAKIISSMRVNQISDPVRTANGYSIFSLRDRRKILSADETDMQVTLHQLLFPSKEGESPDAGRARVRNAVAGIKGCDAIPEDASSIGANDSSRLPAMRIGDLPAGIQEVVEDLPIGQPSAPIDAPMGFRVLIVCDKAEPEIAKPTFDSISESLTQQRLSLMARRYLRDLRRDAIVDYR